MVCTPGWDIVSVCEVPEAVSIIFAEAIVTRYPLGGVGDGAIQVTSTSVSAVCSASKSVTAPPPASIAIIIHLMPKWFSPGLIVLRLLL